MRALMLILIARLYPGGDAGVFVGRTFSNVRFPLNKTDRCSASFYAPGNADQSKHRYLR
jgi:hypothetical protein